MRALLVALFLTAPVLSGCLDALLPDQGPPAITAPEYSLEVPVTVHVVAVGFDGRLKPDLLLKDLPVSRLTFDLVEAYTTGKVTPEPIQLRLNWQFHEAPEAFAQGFFGAAKAASFEGPGQPFLINYDHNRAEGKVWGHSPLDMIGYQLQKPRMDYIDALKVESWVEQNRAAHGLEFGQPSYTVFIVDSHTKAYLPTDRYHYYYFDDGTREAEIDAARPSEHVKPDGQDEFHTPKDPTSMRGWGGTFDFAWIDVGAAPSWLDYEPWVPPFEDDNKDHPVWDIADDPAKMHRNLRRHLEDFAYVKLLRTPIYDFEAVHKWTIPVYVYIEQEGLSNHKEVPMFGTDPTQWLTVERIEKAFEDLAPWVDTTISVEILWLPTDDPGMAEAVRQAKAYGSPAIVSSGVIEDYIARNWDRYAPAAGPDERVMPQFMFFLDGFYTFWGPNLGGGYAAGDAWGRAWAAFNHIPDLCSTTGRDLQGACIGTKAQKWQDEAGTLDMLVIHEGGHHVGLTHARDTSLLTPEGDFEGMQNWFWDSVVSVMTYRHQNPAFDRWDRDVTARGHAGWALNQTVQRLAAGDVSAEAREAAEAGVAEVEGLLRAGAWQDAAVRAIGVRDALFAAAGRLVWALPETTVESLGGNRMVPVSTGTGGGFGPSAGPLAIPLDSAVNTYVTEIEIRDGIDRLTLGIRDLRPQTGTLRFAYLLLLDPEEKVIGFVGNDISAMGHITHLPAVGPHKVMLVTNGGVASEYAVQIDAHYLKG